MIDQQKNKEIITEDGLSFDYEKIKKLIEDTMEKVKKEEKIRPLVKPK